MIVPMPRLCPQQMALIDSFVKAVSDYNQLQAAQIAALVRGEGFRFGREMRSAQKEVGLRKKAILGIPGHISVTNMNRQRPASNNRSISAISNISSPCSGESSSASGLSG